MRSDCWIEVSWPAPGNAPTIQIASKVQALYGESIRTTIVEALATLDANDLSVIVEDQGALPYVLMARLETAVRRLHAQPPMRTFRLKGSRDALPPINPETKYPTDQHRLRRSRLYLPGNTPKYFINAGLHRPDAVILDLEDSVAPQEKDAARVLVRNALRAVSFYGAEKIVRVNALPAGLDEIAALAPHGVHAFVLPKVEQAGEVIAAHRLLEQLRHDVYLIPTVETARGVLGAQQIAACASSVVALSIGLEDYAADIGAQRTLEGRESLWARSQIVNAARAAGIQPLSSVFAGVDDAAQLDAWVRDQRGLGFDGVACIHPRQVAVVHRAFRPSPIEVERAQRIVSTFEQAMTAGLSVTNVDGWMVDAPVVARARQTLQLARSS